MNTIETQDIMNYAVGSLVIMPLLSREQLESMIILHFDIPDDKAKRLAGQAVIKLLETYRGEAIIRRNELQQLVDRIKHLEEITPSYLG